MHELAGNGRGNGRQTNDVAGDDGGCGGSGADAGDAAGDNARYSTCAEKEWCMLLWAPVLQRWGCAVGSLQDSQPSRLGHDDRLVAQARAAENTFRCAGCDLGRQLSAAAVEAE
eukprot:357111-Chlamydomonas_euryale.AAC.7